MQGRVPSALAEVRGGGGKLRGVAAVPASSRLAALVSGGQQVPRRGGRPQPLPAPSLRRTAGTRTAGAGGDWGGRRARVPLSLPVRSPAPFPLEPRPRGAGFGAAQRRRGGELGLERGQPAVRPGALRRRLRRERGAGAGAWEGASAAPWLPQARGQRRGAGPVLPEEPRLLLAHSSGVTAGPVCLKGLREEPEPAFLSQNANRARVKPWSLGWWQGVLSGMEVSGAAFPPRAMLCTF